MCLMQQHTNAAKRVGQARTTPAHLIENRIHPNALPLSLGVRHSSQEAMRATKCQSCVVVDAKNRVNIVATARKFG